MERSSDPAHIRLGINLGSSDDGVSAAKLLTTLNEVISRSLNLIRLAAVAAPILVQCFYIHSVDFISWLFRLLFIYAILGVVCFLAVPDQMYNGLGLGAFRSLFERFYPEIAQSNGSLTDTSEKVVAASVGGQRTDQLGGAKVRIRWHGSSRFLCLSHDGWAVTGGETYATTFLLQYAHHKEKKIPDTYLFRIHEPMSDFHLQWLSFKPVNHLRFGGWLGAYADNRRACPYKLVRDSVCAPDCCKLLCAWTAMLPPAQKSCAGFYLAEQLSGGQLYIGHASDRDAAMLEFVFV